MMLMSSSPGARVGCDGSGPASTIRTFDMPLPFFTAALAAWRAAYADIPGTPRPAWPMPSSSCASRRQPMRERPILSARNAKARDRHRRKTRPDSDDRLSGARGRLDPGHDEGRAHLCRERGGLRSCERLRTHPRLGGISSEAVELGDSGSLRELRSPTSRRTAAREDCRGLPSSRVGDSPAGGNT